MTITYESLALAAFYYPAIDNHAHPFLTASQRSAFDFEGLISEAQGDALKDSVHTLACFRATAELGKLYGMQKDDVSWESVKEKRASLDYDELCAINMKPTGIQCILIDDGLGGVNELAESYSWHDKFTTSPTKRIVRVEVVAQNTLEQLVEQYNTSPLSTDVLCDAFSSRFFESIKASAKDPEVAGFKSVACYRTGLDISITCTSEEIQNAFAEATDGVRPGDKIRLSTKVLNDYLVRMVLEIAGQYKKPVQFHTGLGDNDIKLVKSSPAHMQPIIEAYPDTTFVLLHSSYPYTQDAGYLAAVYKNAYLDFGEIFPFLSGDGQRAVIRQVLELSPANKILWSTDGHWWPESFYLGVKQSREALYEVLAESVRREELTETQAVAIVQMALFENSNRIYGLGLRPNLSILG